MAVLPPGVSAERFASAIRQFEVAVGKDWVFTIDEDLVPYRDPWSLMKDTPGELLPSAAVGPATVEQVQAIVMIANQFKIPLYSISAGKNFGVGGPAPNVRGSVIVDLKRMNRVLELSEDRHFALVEPGVSYFDLYRTIQERGLKLWVDTPDPGWGSVTGNALDHGFGATIGSYRDHWGSHCGLEVVLANGEVMRTGMGAMPNSRTWQEYKHGFGPDPSGLFAQGNFGIVTKFGIRLAPQPEHYRSGLITVPRRRDLAGLVKAVNYLSDLHMIGEPLYNSPLDVLMGDTDFRAAATRIGGFDDDDLDRRAAAAELHAFGVELQFYGSDRTTRANWEYAQELVIRYVPEARATAGESLAIPLTAEQFAKGTAPYRTNVRRSAVFGVPSLGMWTILGRREQQPDEWPKLHFGQYSVVPREAAAVFEAQRVWVNLAHELGVQTYVSAIMPPFNFVQPCFQMTAAFTLKDSPTLGPDMLKLRRRLLEVNAEHGWGENRAEPLLQDDVASHFSFNNFALRRFHETIKDAIDPNGILSPGRGGVWPKGLRARRGTIGK